MGKALTKLRKENVLILGSGFTFHNLQAMLSPNADDKDEKNEAFEEWLIETFISPNLIAEETEHRLIEWSKAPYSRYCHPREEHLIPLHVCYGCTETHAELVFHDQIMGKKASGYLW